MNYYHPLMWSVALAEKDTVKICAVGTKIYSNFDHFTIWAKFKPTFEHR